MDRSRNLRAWAAAVTVGMTFSLLLLAVERHLRIHDSSCLQALKSVTIRAASKTPLGILLTKDPQIAAAEKIPTTDRELQDQRGQYRAESASNFIQRPPEPAPSVALNAPIAIVEPSLPLHSSNSNLEYLMDAMDDALDSPIKSVSTKTAVVAQRQERGFEATPDLPSPALITGRVPRPKRLLEDLDSLEALLVASMHGKNGHGTTRYIGKEQLLTSSDAMRLHQWVLSVQNLLDAVVMKHGLEHPESYHEITGLLKLADQATAIGEAMTDHRMAARIIHLAYDLQRRAAVWNAVQHCLDGTSIGLNESSSPSLAREELRQILAAAESKIEETANPEWREYLLIEQLRSWVDSSENIWTDGHSIAQNVLSRLNWERVTKEQAEFLSQKEFTDLADLLVAWSRDPVDYRKLLEDLEHMETAPLSRSSASIAGAVQVLRHAKEPAQQELATILNNHFRNANLRISLSREMIQRFMPEEDIEFRPIRRRILGADTRGGSQIHTELDIALIPDPKAWNIDIGVVGDLTSNTSSSKGPATFHNTSEAFVSSHRYLRLDPFGYRVSSKPTDVASRDYLRRMDTDYDGLPLIGDFVRLIAREQFDQRRGLAKRVSHRIIRQETDAELDKRLNESLDTATRQLEKQIIGPLEQLQLNPMVVAMQTTEERLSIRYRVANETQMASFTARPRAPSDSLLSMQLHESTINNTISSMQLSGRVWTIADLYARLGEIFQDAPWTVPEDVPNDVTILFAKRNPVTVEVKDGRLRLTLRISELRRGRNPPVKWFHITTSYVPVAEGLNAELVRDGVIEVKAPYSRDRVKARIIFAKVFVSQPKIPLVSPAWLEDPRSDGLAVSQVELRNGWMSVAISTEDSSLAQEVAQRARELKSKVVR